MENSEKRCNTCNHTKGMNCTNEKAKQMTQAELYQDVINGYNFGCRYWQKGKK
jgi:hypothetical protein